MPISGWVMFGYFWLVILTGVGLAIWGWRTGQFRDTEEARYVVLKERQPEPWPGREQTRDPESPEERQD